MLVTRVGCAGALTMVGLLDPLSVAAAEIRVSTLGWNADDSTEFLQKALDSGAEKVVVDRAKGPWVTRPLFVRSNNQEIVIEKGVELVAKRGEFLGLNDCLFTCRNVTNVTIRGYGALWRMHRADYDAKPYAKGEWRHSLAILGSDHVTVEGLTLLESGGDGVYIATGAGYRQVGPPPTDIVLRDLVCDRHYRQGISVISARRLLIERCVMKNTFGTPPAAGIDFEPNDKDEELVDCTMRDCTLVNNQGNGIEFCFMMLDGTTKPLSVTVENCRTHGNGRSVMFSSWNKPTFPKGFVRLKGCSFVDAQYEALGVVRKPLDAYSIAFEDCKFVNAQTTAPDATKAMDIRLSMRNWDDATTDGVRFDRCTVRQPVSRDWITPTTPTLVGEQVKSVLGSVTVESPTDERKLTLDKAWISRQFKEVVAGGMPPYKPFDALKAAAGTLASSQAPLAPMNVRHKAVYRFFAGAAGRVRLSGHQVLLGRKMPAQNKMTLRDASGKELSSVPIFPAQEKEVSFDVPRAGFYTLTVQPASNAIRLTAANVPVALEVPEGFVNLIASAGKVKFRKDADKRAVLVFKGDGPERVNATVSDPDGCVVWAEDGMSDATAFSAAADAKAGLWTLELKPPTNAPFEDCSILMRGLQPELFLSKANW